jgi:hypothetical protein
MLAMTKQGLSVLPVLGWLLAAVAGGLLAFLAGRLTGSAAPLDTALPAVPRLCEILPREDVADTSLLEMRMPEVLLEFLAPQPDGVPPLLYLADVELVGFKISHPKGAIAVQYPLEEVLEDGVLLQAQLEYDPPLKALKYSMPFRKEGESVTEYTARIRQELERKGATFYADVSPIALEDYRMEHFEYFRELDSGEVVSHYSFIGPLGKRVLVLDYMMPPELHEQARPWVYKIVRSFRPGQLFKEEVRKQDAAYIAFNDLSADAPPPVTDSAEDTAAEPAPEDSV